MMKYIQAKSPYRGHCGISMNKRWLYGLYICLSKELSISRSGSLYIINLRSASAFPPPDQIISLSQHFTTRTTNTKHEGETTINIFVFFTTFNPPCQKVDLGSFVKLSQDLHIIRLVNSYFWNTL